MGVFPRGQVLFNLPLLYLTDPFSDNSLAEV